MMHLVKTMERGLASTKCGLANQSTFNVSVWWSDVDCPTCVPTTWVPADDGTPGLKMVRKAAAPKRRIVKVRG